MKTKLKTKQQQLIAAQIKVQRGEESKVGFVLELIFSQKFFFFKYHMNVN